MKRATDRDSDRQRQRWSETEMVRDRDGQRQRHRRRQTDRDRELLTLCDVYLRIHPLLELNLFYFMKQLFWMKVTRLCLICSSGISVFSFLLVFIYPWDCYLVDISSFF